MWKTIERAGTRSGVPATAVVLSTRVAPRAGRQYLLIEIGVDLRRALGLDDGDRLEVAEGNAEHVGRLRLRPAEAGGHSLRLNKAGVARFTLALPSGWRGKTFRRQVLDHERNDLARGGTWVLFLTLPPGSVALREVA